jgi:transposase-like protein
MPVQQADRQMRSAMNLGKLIDRFGTDDRARGYLLHLRWPDGVRCPKCDSDKVSRIGWTDKTDASGKVKKGRRQLDCNSCRYRYSVTTGTVFHDSHLPLWKWFAATYLMCESKKGLSANQLMRMLGIGSYKTAWYLCHRIRSAMVDEWEPLTGTIEIDETYIGGKRRRVGRGYTENKAMVMGALQRGGDVRLRFIKDQHHLRVGVAHKFVADTVADEAEAVYTDDHKSYQHIGDENTRHEVVHHGVEEWVRGDVSTQGVESAWSLLKRSIVGSYHQLSEKHLPAYLDEFSFRFNNRENPYLFRDTLLRLVHGDTLPYSELIHAS